MKLFTFKRFFVVSLLMCLGVSQGWANVKAWSQATVYAVSNTGAGKVYVSKETTPPTDEQYAQQKNDKQSSDEKDGFENVYHTYYRYAKPENGSLFGGWYSDKDLTNKESILTAYNGTTSILTLSILENAPSTGNYYAKFVTIEEALTERNIPEDIAPYLAKSTAVQNAISARHQDRDLDNKNFSYKTLDEANDENAQPHGKYDAALVKRSFTGGRWNTFCVPFNMATADLTIALGEDNGVEIKKLANAINNNGSYTLQFDNAGEINAGQCYLVWVDTDVPEAVLGGADANVSATLPATTAVDGVTFQGTYNKQDAPQGSYIINDNKFYQVDSKVNVNAFRGWFVLPENTTVDGEAPALSITFDDSDVTGITFVNENASTELSTGWYNIAGQRVNENAKGIIIKNGKKFFVK